MKVNLGSLNTFLAVSERFDALAGLSGRLKINVNFGPGANFKYPKMGVAGRNFYQKFYFWKLECLSYISSTDNYPVTPIPLDLQEGAWGRFWRLKSIDSSADFTRPIYFAPRITAFGRMELSKCANESPWSVLLIHKDRICLKHTGKPEFQFFRSHQHLIDHNFSAGRNPAGRGI